MPVQSTSLEVYYNQVLPMLGNRQREVLNFFLRPQTRGDFTNLEIAEGLGWRISSVTNRTNELRKMGLLEKVLVRPCAITGNNAWAQQLTQMASDGKPILILKNVAEHGEVAPFVKMDGDAVVITRYIPNKQWVKVDDFLKRRGYKYRGFGKWTKKVK